MIEFHGPDCDLTVHALDEDNELPFELSIAPFGYFVWLNRAEMIELRNHLNESLHQTKETAER